MIDVFSKAQVVSVALPKGPPLKGIVVRLLSHGNFILGIITLAGAAARVDCE